MKTVLIGKAIKKVSYNVKIPRSKFLPSGKYPVVSQEQGLVNGYWDDPNMAMSFKNPIIIFGDHTKTLKFVDFDFVLGADGVKVLDPIDSIDPKYFFYALTSINLADLGYARHFRLLKERAILYPESIKEQKRIVKRLDRAFVAIDKAKENTEKNLKNIQELFKSELSTAILQEAKKSSLQPLNEVCAELFAGGDVPKNKHSKLISESYQTPIYSNGIRDHGLYGYTSRPRVIEPSVTISARGTIGHAELRTHPFYPVVRLIVATPNQNLIRVDYLYYVISNINFTNTGTSIPQLTVPMVRDLIIPVPSLERQKQITNRLKNANKNSQKLQKLYQQKLDDLEELRQSILKQALESKL